MVNNMKIYNLLLWGGTFSWSRGTEVVHFLQRLVCKLKYKTSQNEIVDYYCNIYICHFLDQAQFNLFC